MEQGLPPVEVSTSSEPLPPITPLQPELLPVPLVQSPHEFRLPQNTVGQARVRNPTTNIPQAAPLVPIIPRFPAMMPVPLTFPQQPQSSPIPFSTRSYRKKKREEELAGQAPKRYKERTGPSKCSKCGGERTGEHKQYYGNWYCPTSGETYEQWREKFGDKYKRKK